MQFPLKMDLLKSVVENLLSPNYIVSQGTGLVFRKMTFRGRQTRGLAARMLGQDVEMGQRRFFGIEKTGIIFLGVKLFVIQLLNINFWMLLRIRRG